jgi:hypothetical protein
LYILIRELGILVHGFDIGVSCELLVVLLKGLLIQIDIGVSCELLVVLLTGLLIQSLDPLRLVEETSNYILRREIK